MYTADETDGKSQSYESGLHTIATTTGNEDAETDPQIHQLVQAKRSECYTRPGSVGDHDGPSTPMWRIDARTGSVISTINDPLPISDEAPVANPGAPKRGDFLTTRP